MKYKLLSISKDILGVNIGDYIQALASSQFYPHIDGFIERDELKLYRGEKCMMIMNGWYMAKPENWPPSNNINPLFVAFHINSKAKDKMLSAESIRYLKKYEPIGCRDTYTANLLKEHGINAYFSGCMTLTLGEKYHNETHGDKVFFVDPYFTTCRNIQNKIKGVLYLLLHFLPILKIARKYPENKSLFRKCMILTGFYREYSRFFSKDILINAEYICQQDSHYKSEFPNNEALLKEAERLVKEYAKARLVITSRIHCALPCLGLGTPVIYTENSQQSEASACRFGGLKDLFNVFSWDNGKLKCCFNWNIKISRFSEIPQNKDSWEILAKALIARCKCFVRQDGDDKK